jgi:hypothetical protein
MWQPGLMNLNAPDDSHHDDCVRQSPDRNVQVRPAHN